MKKHLSLSLLMAASLLLAACTSSTPGTPSPTTLDPVAVDVMPDSNDSFEGLTVEMAESMAAEKEVPFRIIMQGGEPLPATMDYRPGRINATVENGIVVGVVIEGMEDFPEPITEREDEIVFEPLPPEICVSYFDGCNNCRKEPGSYVATCTEKFCEEYGTPRCLDDEMEATEETTLSE